MEQNISGICGGSIMLDEHKIEQSSKIIRERVNPAVGLNLPSE